jgi:hypothetical protein
MPKFKIDLVTDPHARDTFKTLQREMNDDPIMGTQWKRVEIDIDEAVTDRQYPHGFKSIPTDIFPSWKTGSGEITFNYGKFDAQYIYYTTTGPVKFRGFVGTFGSRKV